MLGETPHSSALSRIRVLDLTRVLAGPFCTMVLGDLGAEVLKVEEPSRGDDSRHWGPPYVGPLSAYFIAVNRNKRSLGIDLREPDGQALIRQLAGISDVVIENFRPTTMERWGLGYETLREINPGLVYCSITGFGSDGSHGHLPGYDTIVEALSGLMSITGPPEGPPSKVGVAIIDVVTGLFAAVSILAALEARRSSNEGQRVEVALLDVAFASLVNVAASYLASGAPPARYGNDHMSIAPFGVVVTSDGDLMLAVGNDAQWQAFAGVVDPPLGADPQFRTNELRVQNRAQLDAALADAMRAKDTKSWCAELAAVGVPAAPVLTVADALSAEELRVRNVIQSVTHSAVGHMEF